MRTTHTFNPSRGWLTGLATAVNGSALIQETIGHAANGLVTARSDGATGLSESFSYDALNRLTASSGNASIPAKTIQYDGIGNITNKSGVGGYSYGAKPHQVTAVTPLSGPMLSYAYDADGNMTSGGGRSLSYDPNGMVTSVTDGASTVSYAYTPDGQRVLQFTSTETDRYYSFDAATHTELQSFSSGAWRMVDYLHGPGGLIGAIYTTIPAGGGAATATTLYYALDHLGSIAATVNAASASPVLRSYDGWGKQRFTSGADDTANTLWGQNAELRGFLGQKQVAANGLVNLNARMYDPWLGRFLAVDPVIASIYRLQALNPYSYVENNPLTLSDPSGLCFITCPFRAIYDAYKTITKFDSRALGKAEIPILAIVAAATFQYEVFPALVGAESFSALSFGLQTLDVGLSGAIGGAINTGTLRGALVGAGTAEAFWGVGEEVKPALGLTVQTGVTPTVYQAAGSAALHAAVGCASSAAGGGRCGSGALSGGLGDLIVSAAGPLLPDNMYVQSAVAGLGGGTGAALTGGRFGDGFFIAASGYLFNDLARLQTTQTGLGGGNQAASSVFQQAQWFVPLLEVPPVEQLTPFDELPPGAAGGPRSGMDFPRSLGKPQGDDPYPPCTYCGEDTGPGNLHRDHIIPKSQGGNGSEDNLAPSCPSCNLSKGPQTPQQWYNWLQNR